MLNFGCSGFSTTLEAVLVREYVRTFAPDVVVCLHHFSDVNEDWSFARHAECANGHVLAVQGSVRELDFNLGQMLRTSQLYRVARACTARRPMSSSAGSYKQTFDAVVHEPYAPDDEEAWTYSLHALADMADDLRQDGIPFLVAVIPIGTQVEPVAPEYAASLGLAYLAAGKRLEHCGYQRKLAGFCTEHDIDCLDLLPAFREANPDGTPRLYCRASALDGAGHDLAAHTIATHLRRRLP